MQVRTRRSRLVAHRRGLRPVEIAVVRRAATALLLRNGRERLDRSTAEYRRRTKASASPWEASPLLFRKASLDPVRKRLGTETARPTAPDAVARSDALGGDLPCPQR